MTPLAFRINERLRVSFEPHPDGLLAVWDPRVPAQLTSDHYARYRAALAVALAARGCAECAR